MLDRHTIIGIGEVLWDMFPDSTRFGGAPANFCCSAAGLGREQACVHLVSSIGTDDLGARALAELQNRSVDTLCVTSQDKPTGVVRVELDDKGSPTYEFAADTAWDNLTWSADLSELASRTDACCFGTLGQRSEMSRATIQKFVNATPTGSLRIFDVNLRPPFVSAAILLNSLKLANVLKLNNEELPVVSALCGVTGTDEALLHQLTERFRLRAIALTCGAKGAVLLRDGQISEHPGLETTVIDTVGAGDAFTASFALGLLAGHALDTINQHACEVAAFVCSQPGATPDLLKL